MAPEEYSRNCINDMVVYSVANIDKHENIPTILKRIGKIEYTFLKVILYFLLKKLTVFQSEIYLVKIDYSTLLIEDTYDFAVRIVFIRQMNGQTFDKDLCRNERNQVGVIWGYLLLKYSFCRYAKSPKPIPIKGRKGTFCRKSKRKGSRKERRKVRRTV